MNHLYRKKPVVIEAIQILPVTSSRDHLDKIRDFMGGEERRNIDFGINYSTGVVTIVTLEGTMRANVGDWIIKGVKGELYPCKPDIFEQTYEKA